MDSKDPNSDHTQIVKKIQEKNGKTNYEGLNSLVNHGMVSKDGKGTQLQSVSHERNISLLKFIDGKLHHFIVRDPHHDSNKLYASLKGLPKGTWFPSQLEEVGANQKDLIDAQESTSTSSQDDIQVSGIVGSAWLDSSKELPDQNTKICIAIFQKGNNEIQIICYSIVDLFTNQVSCSLSNLFPKIQSKIKEGDFILPILLPKRIVDDSGVYFFG